MDLLPSLSLSLAISLPSITNTFPLSFPPSLSHSFIPSLSFLLPPPFPFTSPSLSFPSLSSSFSLPIQFPHDLDPQRPRRVAAHTPDGLLPLLLPPRQTSRLASMDMYVTRRGHRYHRFGCPADVFVEAVEVSGERERGRGREKERE